MEEVVGSIPTRSTKSSQSFRSTSLPRVCRILVANSKTTPLTDFASGISPCAEGAFRFFAGPPFFVVTLEFARADRAFDYAFFAS